MGMSAVNVNDKNFKQEVLEASTPVLVDFWAPWCGPCSMVGPVVEEIAKSHQGKLKVCKVNVDDCPSSASSYGVMSIPTLVLFKNGKEADRIVGAVARAAIEKMVDSRI